MIVESPIGVVRPRTVLPGVPVLSRVQGPVPPPDVNQAGRGSYPPISRRVSIPARVEAMVVVRPLGRHPDLLHRRMGHQECRLAGSEVSAIGRFLVRHEGCAGNMPIVLTVKAPTRLKESKRACHRLVGHGIYRRVGERGSDRPGAQLRRHEFDVGAAPGSRPADAVERGQLVETFDGERAGNQRSVDFAHAHSQRLELLAEGGKVVQRGVDLDQHGVAARNGDRVGRIEVGRGRVVLAIRDGQRGADHVAERVGTGLRRRKIAVPLGNRVGGPGTENELAP